MFMVMHRLFTVVHIETAEHCSGQTMSAKLSIFENEINKFVKQQFKQE